MGEGLVGEENSEKGSLSMYEYGFRGDCLIKGFLGEDFVKKSSKRSTWVFGTCLVRDLICNQD